MAKKPTIQTISTGYYSRQALNNNFEELRDAFDNTLSLDGSTPNAMQGDLDLNGNNLIGATGLLINGTDYLADVEAAKAAALVAQAAAELAENNAETAEVNAEASETAAGLSATAAATSATAAQTAQTATELAETNAGTSESNAATSATNAATSEANASTSASTASTKASEAATSATNAATSATEAETAKTGAETARDAALAALDSFDDRYLGVKASDPTVDNDGDALVVGAIYFNSSTELLYVYNGTTWQVTANAASGDLVSTNNLSDLTSPATARTNLGLGTGSTPTFAGIDTTRLATTPTGIDVTGTVTADGLTVDGGTTTEIKVFSQGRVNPTTLSEGASGAELMVGSSNPLTLGTASLDRLTVASNGDISFYEDTGTTPKFFWDASAESLGIGTNLPEESLHVKGSIKVDLGSAGGNPRIYLDHDSATDDGNYLQLNRGDDGLEVVGQDNVKIRTNGSERMRIDSSGNVGIGTSSPDANLEVENTSGAASLNVRGLTDTIIRARQTGDTGFGYFSFGRSNDIFVGGLVYDHNDDNMRFNSNNAEAMRIDSSGNVGIGTTGPTEKLHVSGNILATGDVTAFSDERLKTEIETISEAVDKVKQLRGVTFQKDGRDSLGVIAQEVQKVLPEVVHESGDYLSVAYGNIVGLLIEAVKEQQEQIDELKAVLASE